MPQPHSLPLFAALLVPVLLATGCAKQKKPESGYDADITQATGFFAEGQPGAGASAVNMAEVVIRVNGRPITRGQLMSDAFRLASMLGLPPERMAQERDRLLAEAEKLAIRNALLVELAAKENIQVPASDLAGHLERMKAQLPAGANLEDELRKKGLTLDQFTENLRESLRLEKLVEAHTADVAAPAEAEIASFYQENPRAFAHPEMVSGLHIVKSIPANSPDPKAAVAALIKDMEDGVRVRALDPKTDFEQLALEQTQQKGTDGKPQIRATFLKGKLLPDFEKEIFSLATNQVSQVLVVEKEGIAHLFKLLERKEAGIVPLAQAKEAIQDQLLRKKKDARLAELVENLMKEAKIERTVPAGTNGTAAKAPEAAAGGKE